jgi:hypothetical protein
MQASHVFPRRATRRDLLFFATPALWRMRPFLPVIRRNEGRDHHQLGVMYDAIGASNRYGFSATVFITNLFTLPSTEEEFFALAKCVYDTFDELAADGWVVD